MPFAVFSNSVLTFAKALTTFAERLAAEGGRIGGISIAIGSEHRPLAGLPEALLPLTAALTTLCLLYTSPSPRDS